MIHHFQLGSPFFHCSLFLFCCSLFSCPLLHCSLLLFTVYPPYHCSLLLFCCSFMYCFPLVPLFTVIALLSTFCTVHCYCFVVYFSTVHCYYFVAVSFSHVASNGRSSGSVQRRVRRNQKARLLSSSFMGQMKPSSFSLHGCRGDGNWNCWQKMGPVTFLGLLSKQTRLRTCCGFWWGLMLPRWHTLNTGSSTRRSPCSTWVFKTCLIFLPLSLLTCSSLWLQDVFVFLFFYLSIYPIYPFDFLYVHMYLTMYFSVSWSVYIYIYFFLSSFFLFSFLLSFLLYFVLSFLISFLFFYFFLFFSFLFILVSFLLFYVLSFFLSSLFPFFLSFLHVFLSFFLPSFLSFFLSFFSFCLSFFLSFFRSFFLFFLSVNLSIYLFIFLSINGLIHLTLHLSSSISQSVYLSIAVLLLFS